MSSIFVFCDREELQDWLVDFAVEKDLRIVFFSAGSTGELISAEMFRMREDIYAVYLLPPSAYVGDSLRMNDVRPRNWGWIDIRPGDIVEDEENQVLLFSEIHGERCDRSDCDPEKLVRWLKRVIKSKVRIGVVGRNTTNGGESVYDDIWYTNRAKQLFDAGVIWKQFVDANSTFEPRDCG